MGTRDKHFTIEPGHSTASADQSLHADPDDRVDVVR